VKDGQADMKGAQVVRSVENKQDSKDLHDSQVVLQAITEMIRRAEVAHAKLSVGTSQHSLQTNRIKALRLVTPLLDAAAEGVDAGLQP